MFVGEGDYSFNLLVIVWIYNDVYTAREGTVSQNENLGKGGSMRVHDSFPF
jgi:hypothetical protein